MTAISNLHATEILDSRGRPTLLTRCVLEDGTIGKASVPSGASTGASEAVELRDHDLARFGGLGCLKAAGHVNTDIGNAVSRQMFNDQLELDRFLVELDGTDNKSRLGANAILSVSLAYARAVANAQAKHLYAYFAELAATSPHLPHPMINLFSGGKHAGGQVSIQDVQIVFPNAGTMRTVFEHMFAVFQAAAQLSLDEYGARLLTADEGGLAPPFEGATDMLGAAVTSIQQAGLEPGEDALLTVDVASSHFYVDGTYELDGQSYSASELIDTYIHWLEVYPILSLEDPLHEEGWNDWASLVTRTGPSTLILGDDLLCTNEARIQRAVQEACANSLLLKVNQIGTITEALESYRTAKSAGWDIVISARSGETEDGWLADLAVGWGADYIKVGSITQSERLAKYNRLLELEDVYGISLAES